MDEEHGGDPSPAMMQPEESSAGGWGGETATGLTESEQRLLPLDAAELDPATLNLTTLQYELDADELALFDRQVTGKEGEGTLETRRRDFSREWVRRKLRPRAMGSAKEVVEYLRVSMQNFVPTLLFTLVLGTVCGVIGAGGEYAVVWLGWCRTVMLRDLGGWAGGYWTNYALWVLFTVFMGSVSMVIGYLTPECTGGGTPELRAMMTGRLMPKVLALRTIVSKFFGIILTVGGGMVAGKQGPMAQICAGVAYNLMRLPFFRRFATSPERKYEMIGAAIGVSGGANFLAPFAGAMWGFEFCSSHATVRLFWISFIGSVTATMVSRWLLFSTTYLVVDLPRNVWRWEDLHGFALVGLLCGLLSSLEVRVLELIVRTRRALSQAGRGSAQKKFFGLMAQPQLFGFAMILLTAVVTYPGTYAYLGLGTRGALLQLWGKGALTAGSWNRPSVLQALALYTCTRWALFTFTCTSPMPFGTFAPCLVVGAGIGRFIGELARIWLGGDTNLVNWDEPTDGAAYSAFYPAAYAIVGSAAYTTALTKTLSASMFILEISGQYQLIVPSMVASATAFVVQNYLADSFYDLMCRLRGLSWVPPVADSLRNVAVREIMVRNVGKVCASQSISEVLDTLRANLRQNYFPVVASKTEALLGYASRRDLLAYLMNSIARDDDRYSDLSTLMMPEAVPPPTLLCAKLGVPPALQCLQTKPRYDLFPVRRVPVILQPGSPLKLVQLLVIQFEQPVILVANEDGRLAGMATREQIIAAIGYRTYFRSLRGLFLRFQRALISTAIPHPLTPLPPDLRDIV